MTAREIAKGMRSLIIFRNILKDKTVNSFIALLDSVDFGTDVTERYAEFALSLFSHSYDIGNFFAGLIHSEENIYTAYRATGIGDGGILEPLVKRELDIISAAASYDGSDARKAAGDTSLPCWHCEKKYIVEDYMNHMSDIKRRGYGIFAASNFFTLSDDGNLIPAASFGVRSLDDMYTYESERNKIIANTEALIEGRPATNVLLYGDAGTGKSSSIKAIAAKYADDGLRLIEVKKEQIKFIPALSERLAENPLKFIIFIDDVTFIATDPACCVLKTVLEGGAGGISPNMAVYVTSNHRRLVKETHGDRNGDEINVQDNIQGVLGLSARFGLTITFMKPDKLQFRQIVCALAREKGIECDEDTLMIRAEAYAIRNNGRTPRAAGQFIDLVYSGVEKL